jgi:hypothetical protein
MSNFAFLQTDWPDLHEAATRAESLAFGDARAACFYARRALELGATSERTGIINWHGREAVFSLAPLRERAGVRGWRNQRRSPCLTPHPNPLPSEGRGDGTRWRLGTKAGNAREFSLASPQGRRGPGRGGALSHTLPGKAADHGCARVSQGSNWQGWCCRLARNMTPLPNPLLTPASRGEGNRAHRRALCSSARLREAATMANPSHETSPKRLGLSEIKGSISDRMQVDF